MKELPSVANNVIEYVELIWEHNFELIVEECIPAERQNIPPQYKHFLMHIEDLKM